MWYQFSSDESYLLIQAARCRIAVLEEAMKRRRHPLHAAARRRAEYDIEQLKALAELLHDGGVWEVK